MSRVRVKETKTPTPLEVRILVDQIYRVPDVEQPAVRLMIVATDGFETWQTLEEAEDIRLLIDDEEEQ
jgi:hypothetical protein